MRRWFLGIVGLSVAAFAVVVMTTARRPEQLEPEALVTAAPVDAPGPAPLASAVVLHVKDATSVEAPFELRDDATAACGVALGAPLSAGSPKKPGRATFALEVTQAGKYHAWVRGRWGEVTLRRVVELAGMSSYCDFDEQVSVETEEGRLRPDMTVRLPNDRVIIVDSKAPLEAYMDAVEASDEAGRKAALGRHTQALRAHVRALCQKAYWSQFDNAPDFVVLFLPGESFFIAALEADRSLMEDAFRSNVVLASPATLFALLKAVATGWQEHALAENAEKIADVGRELYERVRVFAENFRDVGSGLRSAAKAYDAAVGSYQSRLEPGARKLAELGASSGKELPEVEGVEGPTRALPEGET